MSEAPVNKRNVVLKALKAQLVTKLGLQTDQVNIGWKDVSKSLRNYMVLIVQSKDTNRPRDGTTVDRLLKVEIWVVCRIDTLSDEDGDIKFNELHDPVLAALETLKMGVAGSVVTLKEEDGPAFYVTNELIDMRGAGSAWTLHYSRPLGAVG